LVCNDGLNNCQSDFGWQNGDTGFDCCINDPDDDPDSPTASTNRCVDSNCQCTQEEVAEYIDSIRTVCRTIDQSGCKIDRNIVIVNIPDTSQCENELNQLTVDDFVDIEPSDLQLIKQISIGDMTSAFKCMSYSYIRISLGEECDKLGGVGRKAERECESACLGRLEPIFAGGRPGILTFSSYSPFPFDFTLNGLSQYFDYDVPIDLPSREERLFGPRGIRFGSIVLIKSRSFGRLFFDRVPTVDRAAKFIVDIFDEFMGCAVR